jgi:predicted N-acetyltransferase YhbS
MLFVDEAYRRKGVGSMLLKWGIDTARKMDVEGWLNATLLGKPLYEKFGFKVVKENQLVPKKENPNVKWKELEAEVCGGDRAFCVFWAMRLPREDSRSKADDALKS